MMADPPNLPRAPGDTRSDEERAAIAEQFSNDPSKGLVAFHPDGSFDWPSGWSLDRKIRAIDRSRRGGDPNKPAAKLGESHWADKMVEKLREEFGEGIYAKIEEVKQENDAGIRNFLKWKAKEKPVSKKKTILAVHR